MLTLGPSLAAAPQNGAPKPRVSNDPLTAEQVAVYRALLEDYTKGMNGTLNLANNTEPLAESDGSCLKGNLDRAGSSVPIVHQLNPALVLNSKFVLVDPDRQAELVRENDPRNLPMGAIDKPQEPFTKQVADSVNRMFDASHLLTLSEILFDKQHRRAVVAYRIECYGLCGGGDTLVLKRVGKRWRVDKRCWGWVSAS